MNGWARRGPTDANRARGHKWLAIRRTILERDGLACVKCHARADVVDHITPVSRGGTDDPSNLQSMCNACHDDKSRSEGVRVARPKARTGIDGWPV